MSETIYLQLPWPPTLNSYYRTVNGRMLISRDGRKYREAVQGLLAGAYDTLTGRLSVTIRCHAPDNRRRDLDNIGKCLLDSLTKAGIWGDDSQIDDLRFVRCAPTQGGTVKIEIAELENDAEELD